MKVGHFIPAYEFDIKSQVVGQLLRDSDYCARQGWEYVFYTEYSSDLPCLRNKAVEKAREYGWDWLMMQDADVYTLDQQSAIQRLWETAEETEAAVCGAAVGLRGRASKLNVYPYAGAGEVFDVEKMGTGMILIRIAAIEDIASRYSGPWFCRLYGDDRQSKPKVGEDIFFARTIKHFGKRVVCDGRIPTGHVYPDYEALRYDPTATLDTAA